MAAGEPQRNTKQRQVILEELCKLKSHPTAAELYQVVREKMPRISLGTVYRNLELLAKNRIIQKLDTIGVEARFDGNPARHNHIRCTDCGCVGDLHDIPGDFLDQRFKQANGWKIIGCRIEFIGICPGCRNIRQDKSIPEADSGKSQ
ncbi:MAG: transcriptional repressor [candidate division Zixibacteria bacterium]|nr:transcriptional repressor [candidate division Zixibacteria bacterium]